MREITTRRDVEIRTDGETLQFEGNYHGNPTKSVDVEVPVEDYIDAVNDAGVADGEDFGGETVVRGDVIIVGDRADYDTWHAVGNVNDVSVAEVERQKNGSSWVRGSALMPMPSSVVQEILDGLEEDTREEPYIRFESCSGACGAEVPLAADWKLVPGEAIDAGYSNNEYVVAWHTEDDVSNNLSRGNTDLQRALPNGDRYDAGAAVDSVEVIDE